LNWDDVNDILFAGSPEQISSVRCPECGESLKLSYYPNTRSVEICCGGCGAVVKMHGVSQKPNFALLSA
jgi:transcription initiation factor TFIIIB Brf1 subunit/transcription initiation factor TFIIB